MDSQHKEQFSKAERIWFVVDMIPEGRVASYGQIADLAGLPGRARFVSQAMGQAPKEMALPWFRVINAQGRIAIPKSSRYYQKQRELLLAEGVMVTDGKIDLKRFGWKPDMGELLFQLPF